MDEGARWAELPREIPGFRLKDGWYWSDGDSKGRHYLEFKQLLADHATWVLSGGAFGVRADFHGAFFSNADMTDILLRESNLSDARFFDVTLSKANLYAADLSGAILFRVDLSSAEFGRADLSRVIFEPTTLPELRGIASARNLETLTYFQNPDALVQLRKQLQDAGFRDQERRITYALKRRETEISWARCKSFEVIGECGSFVLNTMFFDWASQYGMTPGRPITLVFLLWLLCSVAYFVLILSPGGSGLYRLYTSQPEQDGGKRPPLRSFRQWRTSSTRIEKIEPSSNDQKHEQGIFRDFWREWLVFRSAMFFSLMSAFNIGFQQFDFGRWLRLLTRREFDLKAVGWARVIAGWQSLISVYLFALWILSYFGRPFG